MLSTLSKWLYPFVLLSTANEIASCLMYLQSFFLSVLVSWEFSGMHVVGVLFCFEFMQCFLCLILYKDVTALELRSNLFTKYTHFE